MGLVVKKFGLIAFLIGIVGYGAAMYIGHFQGYSVQEILSYAVMGMIAALVYFGIAYKRDTVNAGQISFRQALATGALISLCGGLGIALAAFSYPVFINANFFEDYQIYQLAIAKENGDEQRVSQISQAAQLNENRSLLSLSFVSSFMMFLMSFTISMFSTLVSAMLLKNKHL